MLRTLNRLNHWTRGKTPLGFLPSCGNDRWTRCLDPQSAFFVTSWESRHNRRNERYLRRGFLAVGFLATSAAGYYFLKNKVAFAEKAAQATAGHFIQSLPSFTETDVAKHSSKENKIWVTYKNGVYDVTEFVEVHPGGDKILMAAGASIEPFWALYGVHHTPEVYAILEEYRIGNLIVEEKRKDVKASDPYAADPVRHPVLKPASVKPFNAEPPPSLLVDSFHTPNSIFYVRNHLPVPEVDASKFRLEVKGIGVRERSFTLEEIKKYPKHTITAAVQCAGNRRSEMTRVKPVKGLSWGHAAIGNATWSGARLTDVLQSCGLDLGRTDVQHVQFEGLDKGPGDVPYGASVPAEKALDPRGDVILAYEMNGEPLPRDHGYPLRVVVPGVVGARNVKWVSRVVLSREESASHWQQNDYKGFSPSTDWDSVDFGKAPAIQELPVMSAICQPEEGEAVRRSDGGMVVKGYAWSGGGRSVVRVDVSADKGKTWHVAELEQTKDKTPRHWGWTLWSIKVPVPEGEKSVEIWAKAVDSSYNTQPENFENIWNLRGVLANAYHKIRVNVSD